MGEFDYEKSLAGTFRQPPELYPGPWSPRHRIPRTSGARDGWSSSSVGSPRRCKPIWRPIRSRSVLVADAETGGHFQKLTALGPLLADVIETNPADMDEEALHKAAYAFVRPSFDG